MQAYVDGGKPVYSFADAAQDQLLSLAIDQSLANGAPVTTTTQPWAGGQR